MRTQSNEIMPRRTFLGNVIGGASAAAVTMPLMLGSIVAVDAITNFEGGNAGVASDSQKETPAQDSSKQIDEPTHVDTQAEEAPTQPELSLGDKIDIDIVAPIVEEATFRALPSALLGRNSNELKDGKILSLTRRELIVGGISTTLFAAAHNLTDEGFSKKYIPAPQFIFGGLAWCLQRRRGIEANVAAHITVNSSVWLY